MYTEETLLQAIEMMRRAARDVALLDCENVARNGHKAVADSMILNASRIDALSARTILDAVVGTSPVALAEQVAFDQEARRLYLDVTRGADGVLKYQITRRAEQIWQAGVRWARNTPEAK